MKHLPPTEATAFLARVRRRVEREGVGFEVRSRPASEATDEVTEFWRWFAACVVPSLASGGVPDDAWIGALDQRMLDLDLAWELGPAPDGPGWAFAVSFGGDLDRLPHAARVVRQAPPMQGCQVLLGKPPKAWDGTVKFGSGPEAVRFHTAGWRCVMLPMGDGVAIVVAPDIEGSEDLVGQAVGIAVVSELGELRFAQRVRDLSVVEPGRLASMPGIRCTMRGLRHHVGG